jgi:hypothetical protein
MPSPSSHAFPVRTFSRNGSSVGSSAMYGPTILTLQNTWLNSVNLAISSYLDNNLCPLRLLSPIPMDRAVTITDRQPFPRTMDQKP